MLMDLKHPHQPMVLRGICASLVNTALRGLQKELAALLVRYVKIVRTCKMRKSFHYELHGSWDYPFNLFLSALQ